MQLSLVLRRIDYLHGYTQNDLVAHVSQSLKGRSNGEYTNRGISWWLRLRILGERRNLLYMQYRTNASHYLARRCILSRLSYWWEEVIEGERRGLTEEEIGEELGTAVKEDAYVDAHWTSDWTQRRADSINQDTSYSNTFESAQRLCNISHLQRKTKAHLFRRWR